MWELRELFVESQQFDYYLFTTLAKQGKRKHTFHVKTAWMISQVSHFKSDIGETQNRFNWNNGNGIYIYNLFQSVPCFWKMLSMRICVLKATQLSYPFIVPSSVLSRRSILVAALGKRYEKYLQILFNIFYFLFLYGMVLLDYYSESIHPQWSKVIA